MTSGEGHVHTNGPYTQREIGRLVRDVDRLKQDVVDLKTGMARDISEINTSIAKIETKLAAITEVRRETSDRTMWMIGAFLTLMMLAVMAVSAWSAVSTGP